MCKEGEQAKRKDFERTQGREGGSASSPRISVIRFPGLEEGWETAVCAGMAKEGKLVKVGVGKCEMTQV